jgi:SSS family transporter
MDFSISAESRQVLIVFALYLAGVVTLGIVSHRYLTRGSFVKEYFVGNRGLGPWVLALTVAATAISGGTFMGFPSLIYSNGWIMALWIASYMVVPLMTMTLFGKRINQVARIAGAVTVPDVLRDRFNCPALGIAGSLLILLFVTFNLVAQFKAGGLVMQTAMELPRKTIDLPVIGVPIEQGYLIGLLIFAFTVVAYTTYGGFWAVTWNDVLQGLVMLAGVLIMAVLAVQAVPAIIDSQGNELHGLAAATEKLRQTDPALVSGPGPADYLPIGMGFSFFLMWSLMSPGQPSGMVRLMSFKDSASVRRALLLISGYYMATYVALLVIFICARAMFPTEYLGLEGSETRGEPDRIMPAMIRELAGRIGMPWVAGLLLAAPYSAIMSTVAAFLLMMSSSLVRDIYQRLINPNVSENVIKASSYLVTGLVGLVVLLGALNPPQYLQYLIVLTGSGQGCAFLVPMAMALYWRRATWQGTFASMLGGFGAQFGLYLLGWLCGACRSALSAGDPPGWASSLHAAFSWLPGWDAPRNSALLPLYMGGVDPLVWGLVASLVLGIAVSWGTRPDEQLVGKFYPEAAPAPETEKWQG